MDRDSLIFMAKLAKHTKRFHDMLEYMNLVVEQSPILTIDERQLLFDAYKNIISSHRSAWRITNLIDIDTNLHNSPLIQSYKTKIESDIVNICYNIIKLINNILLSSDDSPEHLVFYYKMNADYHRYLAEIQSKDNPDDSVINAHNSYITALDIAKNNLHPTHPLRLGLALNFSVFYYEILNNHTYACDLAKEAFDTAIVVLDVTPEKYYKDTTSILELIKDNLSLWAK